MLHPRLTLLSLFASLTLLLPMIAACPGSSDDDDGPEDPCCACWCTQSATEVVYCQEYYPVTKEDTSESCDDVCAQACGDWVGCSDVLCAEDHDCDAGDPLGTPCGIDRCDDTRPHVDVIYPSTNAEFGLDDAVPFLVSVTDDDPALDVQWTDDLYGEITVMDPPPITAADTFEFEQTGFGEGIHIVRIRALDDDGCLGGDDVPFSMGEPPM